MKKQNKLKINAGTAWFLAIVVISILAAVLDTGVSTQIIWLILGICGAMVAVYNIRSEEETNFLIATAAFYIFVLTWLSTTAFVSIIPEIVYFVLFNMLVGLGVAGFIVALGLIFKIAIQK